MKIRKQPFVMGVLGPDPTDVRDFQLSSILPEKITIQEELDLRPMMTPVVRQNYGSCVAHGTTGQKQYLDRRQYGKEINLSKKFVYHNMKVLSGIWFTQADYVRNGLKALQKFGVPLEKDYPDTPEKNWYTYAHKEPSAEVYKKALVYRLGSYWAVGKTLDDYLEAQQQYHAPVVSSMKWYESFNRTEKDGRMPLPSGKAVGGHCFVSAGWTRGKLWFKNSWETSWGKKGFFYIPFEDFDKYPIWNAWVGLDYTPPKPVEGWVAEEYLRAISFVAGQEVLTTHRLHFRKEPMGTILKTLPQGKKLVISGEKKRLGGYTWQKVKVEDDEASVPSTTHTTFTREDEGDSRTWESNWCDWVDDWVMSEYQQAFRE